MESNPTLLFRLHGCLFGVETVFVYEIFELPELKGMAEMPYYVAGFLNVRGEVIPVVDLGLYLGYPQQKHTLNEHVIVFKGLNFIFGIIVFDIVNVKDLTFEMPEGFDQSRERLFSVVSAVVQIEEDIGFIINPALINEKIFHSAREKDKDISWEFIINPEDQPVFSERAQRLMQLSQLAKKETQVPLAIILFDNEFYGVDPTMIKEFSEVELFTPFPSMISHILGFVNHRGEALTLLDICPLLKQQQLSIKPTSKVLILNIDNAFVGVLIDDILDMIYLKNEDFQPVPLELKSANTELIKNAVFYKNEVVGVLDIIKILDSVSKRRSGYHEFT